MIETRSRPLGRVVAHGAILRETPGHMVRILRSVVINEVASHAGLIQSVVRAAPVTARARQRRVAAGQRELRRCRMVECGSLPGCRGVAVRTGLGKERCFVIRIYRRRVLAQVTGHASLIQAVVYSAPVTVRARQRCMAARKRELRVRRVIEACPLPGCRRVAVGTGL